MSKIHSLLKSSRTAGFVIWGTVPELPGRVLRVVTLEDGETMHNAFPDRNFRLPQAEQE